MKMRIKYKICFEEPRTLEAMQPLLNLIKDKDPNSSFIYDGNCLSGTLLLDEKLESKEVRKLENLTGKFSIKILK